MISSFTGRYSFLSNFHECRIEFEGIAYPTVENAFQAAKIYIPADWELTNEIRVNKGFTRVKPGEAKRIGRTVELRPDWEVIKEDIMHRLLVNKFDENDELRHLLISTYPAILIEGNRWHDNYWGRCYCQRCNSRSSLNRLGELLMEIRGSIIGV